MKVTSYEFGYRIVLMISIGYECRPLTHQMDALKVGALRYEIILMQNINVHFLYLHNIDI